jgi:DMSO/TMAO reductase YedYZ molybdopterin-dependent catalytic subunit
MDLSDVSTPGRVAADGEGISAEELGLATRNHGIPLEALRYDITPPGLHYLLIHYDIPVIAESDFLLTVDGEVRRPVSLSMSDLRALPSQTVRVTMECAGNGRARLEPRPVSQPWLVEAVGTAEWTGVPLHAVLDAAGLTEDAIEVVFTGADHGVERGVEQDYQRSLTVAEALREEMLLAYEMNGAALPPQHGFPLRLVAPGWYGMAHVKWLTRVTAASSPFDGFQQGTAYRFRSASGEDLGAVTRIAPRALLVPPGFPDFMTRTRIVRPGPCEVEGRAWSGRSPIKAVEISLDGGGSWTPAALSASDDGRPWAWRRFTAFVSFEPGRFSLCARAYDEDGDVQPVKQAWNRGGFANNAAQRIDVVCLP